ncbi:ATP-binding protein [Alicyclobacillus hesperidum]|uniref:ATP-binding protein n=1 Tax=Alicyclobacillus hesperidum TaxID=89784 RepID=UPI0009450D56|nr:ATP-binding protein [Alicyclobacillus hesperidum]
MPNFIMIQGGLGAGKTLLASLLAQYWHLKSDGELTLYANYELLNARVFHSPEQWIDVAESHGSAIIWDEAQTQFDRRNWQRNTFMTQIFNYARKMRCVHVFVNPVGTNLDSRILDFIEVFMHVTKSQGRGIRVDIYEYQDKRYGDWGRPLKSLWIPWWKIRQCFALHLYNTDSILYPFPTPKTEVAQNALLKRIAEMQYEISEVERQKRKVISGWIQPSDHFEEKRSIEGGEIDRSYLG